MKTLQLFLFFLPLVYFPWAHQQFELMKFVWVLLVGVGCWTVERAYNVAKGGEWTLGSFRKYWIWWFIGSFYTLYLILHTIIVSIAPTVSFWGTYQRHGGLVLYLALVWLLCLFVTRTWSKKELYSLMRTIIYSAVFVSLLALFQKAGYHMYQLFSDWSWLGTMVDLSSTQGRAFATMGHPNFLGQFLLLSIVLTGWYILYSKTKKKYQYTVLALVQLLALLSTWNRASIIVLFVFTLVFLCSYLWKLCQRFSRRILLMSILILLPITMVWSFFGHNIRSALTRTILYSSTIQMIEERIFFGYGLETFGFAFAPFYPEGMGETEKLQDMPDKAHNEILDIISEQGLIGMICIIFLAAILIWYVRKKDIMDPVLWLPIILLCLNELTNLGSFSVVTHRVFCCVFLGMALSVHGTSTISKDRTPHITIRVLATVLGGVSILIASLFLVGDVSFAQYTKSTAQMDQKIWYERAIRISPYPYEYILFGPLSLLDNGERLISIALEENSYDIYAYFSQAELYRIMGRWSEAMNILYQAEKLCPNCTTVQYRMVRLALEMGDKEVLRQGVQRYLELLPWFLYENTDTLSDEWKDRQRIVLKEQEEEIEYILNAGRSIEAWDNSRLDMLESQIRSK